MDEEGGGARGRREGRIAPIKVNEFCCGKNPELFSPSSAFSTLPSPLPRLFLLCEVRLFAVSIAHGAPTARVQRMQLHICVVNLLAYSKKRCTTLRSAPLLPPPLSCERSPPPSPPLSLLLLSLLSLGRSHIAHKGVTFH